MDERIFTEDKCRLVITLPYDFEVSEGVEYVRKGEDDASENFVFMSILTLPVIIVVRVLAGHAITRPFILGGCLVLLSLGALMLLVSQLSSEYRGSRREVAVNVLLVLIPSAFASGLVLLPDPRLFFIGIYLPSHPLVFLCCFDMAYAIGAGWKVRDETQTQGGMSPLMRAWAELTAKRFLNGYDRATLFMHLYDNCLDVSVSTIDRFIEEQVPVIAKQRQLLARLKFTMVLYLSCLALFFVIYVFLLNRATVQPLTATKLILAFTLLHVLFARFSVAHVHGLNIPAVYYDTKEAVTDYFFRDIKTHYPVPWKFDPLLGDHILRSAFVMVVFSVFSASIILGAHYFAVNPLVDIPDTWLVQANAAHDRSHDANEHPPSFDNDTAMDAINNNSELWLWWNVRGAVAGPERKYYWLTGVLSVVCSAWAPAIIARSLACAFAGPCIAFFEDNIVYFK